MAKFSQSATLMLKKGDGRDDFQQKAMDLFKEHVFDSPVFDKLNAMQQKPVRERYLEGIMNVHDEMVKKGLEKAHFGCGVRDRGGRIIVELWDNCGGFPAHMLGEKERPAEIGSAGSDKPGFAGGTMGGKGIGLNNLVRDVIDCLKDPGAESRVEFRNEDRGTGLGAVIVMDFAKL